MAGGKKGSPSKKITKGHYAAPGKPVRKKNKLSARQRRKRNEAASAKKYHERVAAQKERTRVAKENEAKRKAEALANKGKPKKSLSRDPEYDAWMKSYTESVMNDPDIDAKEKKSLMSRVVDHGKDIPKDRTDISSNAASMSAQKRTP